jgi:hypothetical protein
VLLDANANELTEEEKQEVLDFVKFRFYPIKRDYML